jgi:hypothetical protein
MLPPSSVLKCVGSEIGCILYGSYKRVVVTTNERDRDRKPVLVNGKKWTKMEKIAFVRVHWFIVTGWKLNSERDWTFPGIHFYYPTFLILENKRRLMRSPCCLFVSPFNVAGQRLRKHVPAAKKYKRNSRRTVGRGVFYAVRRKVNYLHDSQSRETTEYGHEARGIWNQE